MGGAEGQELETAGLLAYEEIHQTNAVIEATNTASIPPTASQAATRPYCSST